jgi:hypothetical protein
MEMLGYYILKDKVPVRCAGVFAWGRWMEKNKSCIRVAETLIRGYRVSTIFLGIDHNWVEGNDPLLFETIVFGTGPLNQEQARTSTYEEAETIHEKIVIEIIEHRPYWLPVWLWKLLERRQDNEQVQQESG